MRRFALFAVAAITVSLAAMEPGQPRPPLQPNAASAARAQADTQSGGSSPAFAAFTLKLVPADVARSYGGFEFDPSRMRARSIMLDELIKFAYNVESYQLAGEPAWVRPSVSTPLYQFEAVTESPATASEMRPMVRVVLDQCCHLKYHVSSKRMDVYTLRLIGKAPKFAALPLGAKQTPQSPYEYVMPNVQALVHFLNGPAFFTLLGRPVVDKTGLEGDFDIHFTMANSYVYSAADVHLDERLASELGLKLVAETIDVPIMTIDSMEAPSGQ